MTARGAQAARDAVAGHLTLSSAQGRWVLLASVLGTWMTGIDTSVVYVALPTIGRDLHAPFSALQWIVTAYTLTAASLILMGGAAGDRYGRRRMFLLGVIWFGAASTGCALAPTSAALIAARALQGVGGALLIPASLSILQSTFRVEDRARAIGAWAGLNGIAAGIAPLVGGWLLDLGPWRLVFLLNPALAALLVIVVVRHVPESRDGKASGRLDVVGALLAFACLGAMAYAAIAAGDASTARLIVPLSVATGLAALAGFVWWERRARHPLVPLDIFRSRQFSGANLVTFVVYAAVHGFLFLLVIELQTVIGFSALLAGAALVPLAVVALLFSERSARLAHAIGPRLQMMIGPLVCGGGALLTLRLDSHASFARDVLPAMSLFGIGLTLMVAPIAAVALGAVPDSRVGVASGVNNAVARAGRLLAVAALPAAAGLSGSDFVDPLAFEARYRTAVWICVAVFGLASLLAALTMVRAQVRPPHSP